VFNRKTMDDCYWFSARVILTAKKTTGSGQSRLLSSKLLPEFPMQQWK
jgi:hypothetical protein